MINDNTQIASLAPWQFQYLSDQQVGYLTVSQISSLTADQLVMMDANGHPLYVELSAWQLTCVSGAVFASRYGSAIIGQLAISGKNAVLTPDQINAFMSTNRGEGYLTDAQLAYLGAPQVAALTANQLLNLDLSRNQVISKLTGSQLQQVSASALSGSVMQNMTDAQIGVLTANQVGTLSATVLTMKDKSGNYVASALLIQPQVQALSSALLSSSSAANVVQCLSDAQIGWLTPSQVSALSAAALTSTDASGHRVVSVLSMPQLQSLSSAALSDTSAASVVQYLSDAQIGWLTASELSAAVLTSIDASNHRVVSVLSTPQLLSLSSAVFSTSSAVSVMQRLTDAQIGMLTGDKVGALSSMALTSTDASGHSVVSALSAPQVKSISSAVFSSSDVSVMPCLTDGDISWLTASQLGAMTARALIQSDAAGHCIVSMLSQPQLQSLSSAVLSAVVQRLTDAQIGWLTASQVGALSATALTGTNVNGHRVVDELTAVQLAALTVAQLTGTDAHGKCVLNTLTASQLQSLSGATLAGTGVLKSLTDTQIGGLTASQVGALSATALTSTDANGHRVVDELTAGQCGALTSAQLANSDASGHRVVNQLSAAQTSSLANAALSPAVIQSLDNAHLGELSGNQMASLTVSEMLSTDAEGYRVINELLPSLPNSFIAGPNFASLIPYLYDSQIRDLSLDQILALASNELIACDLQGNQISNELTATQVSAIALSVLSDPAAQSVIASLNARYLTQFLNQAQVSALSQPNLELALPYLHDAQFGYLSASQVSALTEADLIVRNGQGHVVLSAMMPNQISALSRQIQAIPADTLGNILPQLTSWQIGSLSGAQVASLNASQLTSTDASGEPVTAGLTPAQVQSISVAAFSASAAGTLIENLSARSQTAYLTQAQIKALIPWSGNPSLLVKFVQALSASQLAALSTQQLLSVFPAMQPAQISAWWNTASWSAQFGVVTAASASVLSTIVQALSNAQVNTALTQWSGSLLVNFVQALSASQLAALPTQQLLALVPVMQSAQVSAWWNTQSSPALDSVMSTVFASVRSTIVQSLSSAQVNTALTQWSANLSLLANFVQDLSANQLAALSTQQLLALVPAMQPAQVSVWWNTASSPALDSVMTPGFASVRNTIVQSLSTGQVSNALTHWSGTPSLLANFVQALSERQLAALLPQQLSSTATVLLPAQISAWWALASPSDRSVVTAGPASVLGTIVQALSSTQLSGNSARLASLAQGLTQSQVNGLTPQQFDIVASYLPSTELSSWWASTPFSTLDGSFTTLSSATRNRLVGALSAIQISRAVSYWSGNSTCLAAFVQELTQSQVNGLTPQQFAIVASYLSSTALSDWWASTPFPTLYGSFMTRSDATRKGLVGALSASQISDAISYWRNDSTCLAAFMEAMTASQLNKLTGLSPISWSNLSWQTREWYFSTLSDTALSSLVAALSADQVSDALNHWGNNSACLGRLLLALKSDQIQNVLPGDKLANFLAANLATAESLNAAVVAALMSQVTEQNWKPFQNVFSETQLSQWLEALPQTVGISSFNGSPGVSGGGLFGIASTAINYGQLQVAAAGLTPNLLLPILTPLTWYDRSAGSSVDMVDSISSWYAALPTAAYPLVQCWWGALQMADQKQVLASACPQALTMLANALTPQQISDVLEKSEFDTSVEFKFTVADQYLSSANPRLALANALGSARIQQWWVGRAPTEATETLDGALLSVVFSNLSIDQQQAVLKDTNLTTDQLALLLPQLSATQVGLLSCATLLQFLSDTSAPARSYDSLEEISPQLLEILKSLPDSGLSNDSSGHYPIQFTQKLRQEVLLKLQPAAIAQFYATLYSAGAPAYQCALQMPASIMSQIPASVMANWSDRLWLSFSEAQIEGLQQDQFSALSPHTQQLLVAERAQDLNRSVVNGLSTQQLQTLAAAMPPTQISVPNLPDVSQPSLTQGRNMYAFGNIIQTIANYAKAMGAQVKSGGAGRMLRLMALPGGLSAVANAFAEASCAPNSMAVTLGILQGVAYLASILQVPISVAANYFFNYAAKMGVAYEAVQSLQKDLPNTFSNINEVLKEYKLDDIVSAYSRVQANEALGMSTSMGQELGLLGEDASRADVALEPLVKMANEVPLSVLRSVVSKGIFLTADVLSIAVSATTANNSANPASGGSPDTQAEAFGIANTIASATFLAGDVADVVAATKFADTALGEVAVAASPILLGTGMLMSIALNIAQSVDILNSESTADTETANFTKIGALGNIAVNVAALALVAAGPAGVIAAGVLSAVFPNVAAIGQAIDLDNMQAQYDKAGRTAWDPVFTSLHTLAALDAPPVLNWFSGCYTPAVLKALGVTQANGGMQECLTQDWYVSLKESQNLWNALNRQILTSKGSDFEVGETTTYVILDCDAKNYFASQTSSPLSYVASATASLVKPTVSPELSELNVLPFQAVSSDASEPSIWDYTGEASFDGGVQAADDAVYTQPMTWQDCIASMPSDHKVTTDNIVQRIHSSCEAVHIPIEGSSKFEKVVTLTGGGDNSRIYYDVDAFAYQSALIFNIDSKYAIVQGGSASNLYVVSTDNVDTEQITGGIAGPEFNVVQLVSPSPNAVGLSANIDGISKAVVQGVANTATTVRGTVAGQTYLTGYGYDNVSLTGGRSSATVCGGGATVVMDNGGNTVNAELGFAPAGAIASLNSTSNYDGGASQAAGINTLSFAQAVESLSLSIVDPLAQGRSSVSTINSPFTDSAKFTHFEKIVGSNLGDNVTVDGCTALVELDTGAGVNDVNVKNTNGLEVVANGTNTMQIGGSSLTLNSNAVSCSTVTLSQGSALKGVLKGQATVSFSSNGDVVNALDVTVGNGSVNTFNLDNTAGRIVFADGSNQQTTINDESARDAHVLSLLLSSGDYTVTLTSDNVLELRQDASEKCIDYSDVMALSGATAVTIGYTGSSTQVSVAALVSAMAVVGAQSSSPTSGAPWWSLNSLMGYASAHPSAFPS